MPDTGDSCTITVVGVSRTTQKTSTVTTAESVTPHVSASHAVSDHAPLAHGGEATAPDGI
jgi:hypothetical protein